MKHKYILLLCTFLLVSHYAIAQTSIAASTSYGTELKQWGGQVQLEYQRKSWSLRVSYARFFKEVISLKPTAINLDIKYELPGEYILKPYVFTGVSLLQIEIQETDDLVSYSTYSGLNLGVGGFFKFNKIQPFCEFKYTTGLTRQWYVSTGLRYQLPF